MLTHNPAIQSPTAQLRIWWSKSPRMNSPRRRRRQTKYIGRRSGTRSQTLASNRNARSARNGQHGKKTLGNKSSLFVRRQLSLQVREKAPVSKNDLIIRSGRVKLYDERKQGDVSMESTTRTKVDLWRRYQLHLLLEPDKLNGPTRVIGKWLEHNDDITKSNEVTTAAIQTTLYSFFSRAEGTLQNTWLQIIEWFNRIAPTTNPSVSLSAFVRLGNSWENNSTDHMGPEWDQSQDANVMGSIIVLINSRETDEEKPAPHRLLSNDADESHSARRSVRSSFVPPLRLSNLRERWNTVRVTHTHTQLG